MQKQPKDDLDRRYALLAFRTVSEFGAAIAAPVVVLSVIGKRLDVSYGTGPAFLIAGFALSALLSAVYVLRRARALERDYRALDAEAHRAGEEAERSTMKRP